GEFDAALCIGVLAYVASVEDTLRRLARALKPGGLLILQITDTDRLLGRIDYWHTQRRSARVGSGFVFNRLSGRDLIQAGGSAGLRLVESMGHVALLPGMGRLPARWLSRYDEWVLRS